MVIVLDLKTAKQLSTSGQRAKDRRLEKKQEAGDSNKAAASSGSVEKATQADKEGTNE